MTHHSNNDLGQPYNLASPSYTIIISMVVNILLTLPFGLRGVECAVVQLWSAVDIERSAMDIECNFNDIWSNSSDNELKFCDGENGTMSFPTVIEGEQFFIDCRVPNADYIEWYKDGILQVFPPYEDDDDDGEQKCNEPEVLSGNQVLYFQQPQTCHNGIYTCVARNNATLQFIFRNIEVHVKPIKPNGDPVAKSCRLDHPIYEPHDSTNISCSFYVGVDIKYYFTWKYFNSSDSLLFLDTENGIPASNSVFNEYSIRTSNDSATVSLEVLDVDKGALTTYMALVIVDNVIVNNTHKLKFTPRYFEYVPLVSVIGSLVLLGLSFAIIWYFVHLDVRIWIKDRKFQHNPVQDEGYWDAFLSYSGSEDDRKFALEEVWSQLRNNSYSVCFPDIHFLPGAAYLDEYVKHIKRSNYCILVLTKNLKSSQHWDFQFSIIMEEFSVRNIKVIPVAFGDVSVTELFGQRDDLDHILRVVDVIRWKENLSARSKRICWKRLCLAMPPKPKGGKPSVVDQNIVLENVEVRVM
ncbi:uncharacterized protein LOC117119100 [Anneissia japonica]|uniref:uncharacterized protein LOC117119100 n=1 Tax=Anneissia japonica TaxID=1529436 RepID=UPI00142567E5|nr:uncharacterized protein LOC117119100 [Anneissia japonica]XP_033119803.1 uncharacterized protein LOC117119100 [Anneissia japonica]